MTTNVVMTIIIPAYNEQESIKAITDEIQKVIGNKFSYEFLFIDDGSKDATWQEITMLSSKSDFVRGIKFSRNFGKEAAIFAGLSNAKGECAVVIDADMQHPPEKIIKMYEEWKNGYYIVEGIKTSRGNESKLRSVFVNTCNKIISKLIKHDMANSSDFKLLDRKVIDALLNMPEKHAFFRSLTSWVGFKSCKIEFEVCQRHAGTSKWSTWALIKYAFNNITSFSDLPIKAISLIGIACMVLSIVLLAYYAFQLVFLFLPAVSASFAFQCLIDGIILFGIGTVGHYVYKIYDEVKNRPRFIIEEKSERDV